MYPEKDTRNAISTTFLWTAVAAMLVAAGCGKTDQPAQEGAPAGAASLDHQAAQSLDVEAEFTEAFREAFVDATQRKLDDLEQDVQDMEARAESQGRLDAFVADRVGFDQQKDKVENELDKVKDADDSGKWKDAKASVQAAYDQLEQAYHEIEKEYGA